MAKTNAGDGFTLSRLMLGSGANAVGFSVIAGSKVDGSSGTNKGTSYGNPGSLLVSIADKKLYINTNTQASPTWTVVGTQS